MRILQIIGIITIVILFIAFTLGGQEWNILFGQRQRDIDRQVYFESEIVVSPLKSMLTNF